MQNDIFNRIATYWGPFILDGYGSRTFPAPVLVNVRWEDTTGFKIHKDGEDIYSHSIVYVKQAAAVGCYLALGDYVTGVPVTDPQTLSNAYLIQDYLEMPSVNGKTILRKAIL